MLSKEEKKIVDLGLTSIDEKFDEGVNQTLDILTKIGIDYLSEKKELKAGEVVVSIKEIGKAAALKRMENVAVNVIRTLEKILQYSIEFTFRPPPLNFSLNLVDLVILAFLDGDYFYK